MDKDIDKEYIAGIVANNVPNNLEDEKRLSNAIKNSNKQYNNKQKDLSSPPKKRQCLNYRTYNIKEDEKENSKEQWEVIQVPGCSLKVTCVPTDVYYKDSKTLWYDPNLLQKEKLSNSLKNGEPKQKKNAKLVFLLGPKACGKTTFLNRRREFLEKRFGVNENHYRVDYEFLRQAHPGYQFINEWGIKSSCIYANASRVLKNQFPNWKLQTSYDFLDKGYDLILTDNGGKKFGKILEHSTQLNYDVHLVIMLISLQTCLERQLKRAKESGRNIKPLKYCKMMKAIHGMIEQTPGTVIVVDNENWNCEIKGVFPPDQKKEAFHCVEELHNKLNPFSMNLYHESKWPTINRDYIPPEFKRFVKKKYRSKT